MLVILAAIFAVGLVFASIELPQLANRMLADAYNTYQEPTREPNAGIDIFPGVDSGQYVEVTEAFLRRYRIRPIGYTCLAVVVALIISGLLAERRGLATAGAVALFLPVFGHFGFSMFFLAGLGLLRTLWMPALDLSYWLTDDLGHWLFRLGDVGHVPYMAITWSTQLVGLDSRQVVSYLAMGFGIFVFILGTATWLSTRLAGRFVAVEGVYRFSRHPQYLGWIIWSYGLVSYLFQEGSKPNFKITWSIPDSLPWLVSSLIIVGVAMVEELWMARNSGAEYERFRARIPFLCPLPRFLRWVVAAPMRLVLAGRKYPETGRQVVAVLAVYFVVLASLSFAMIGLDLPPRGLLIAWPDTVWPFA